MPETRENSLGIATRLLGAGLVLGLVTAPGAALGGTLDQILEVRGGTHVAAAASQGRIDDIADATRDLLNQYRTVTQQVDSLKVYNGQLQKLVTSQEEEMARLQEDIEDVTVVEREIMPLMQRMVEMLGRFVEADVPFLLGERTERVSRLRDLMDRSDVTVAEKYRRLMEAYQIESDFGHTIEAYQGDLEVAGETRTVDFLRIGRVALFYQTLDGESTGTWTDDGWVEIAGGYGSAIRTGLRIARKQAPPDLLLLPVQAAEVVQ